MKNRKKGRPSTGTSNGKIGFRVDDDLKAKWQAEAKKNGMTLTTYITSKMESSAGSGIPSDLYSLFYYHIYTNDGTLRDSIVSKLMSVAFASQSDKNVELRLEANEAIILSKFFSDFLSVFFKEHPDYIPRLLDKDGNDISLKSNKKFETEEVALKLV